MVTGAGQGMGRAISLAFAAEVLSTPAGELAAQLEAGRGQGVGPVLVAENLTLAEVARFELAAYEHPEFEIEVDGRISMEKRSVVAEPGWHRTWLTMEDKHRPDGEKIVVLKVYADGELAGERAFWQRTLPEDP